MKIWNQYLLPNTIDEAIRILREKGGQARLIAGGTDLLLDIQQGRHPPVDTLVDITRIPELQQILTLWMWIGRSCKFVPIPCYPVVRWKLILNKTRHIGVYCFRSNSVIPLLSNTHIARIGCNGPSITVQQYGLRARIWLS